MRGILGNPSDLKRMLRSDYILSTVTGKIKVNIEVQVVCLSQLLTLKLTKSQNQETFMTNL